MGIKGKKVTVVGLARSGVAAANILSYLGADVTVTDAKGPEDLKGSIERLEMPVVYSLGGHPERIFLEADFIVVSPGVPMEIGPLTLAREIGVPIISEIELAYLLTDTPFLAVTGTNGKSTTTALIALMLKEAGLKTILGGNIGNALTEEIYKLQFMAHRSRSTVDYIVTEVSSFQLEGMDTFRPHVATILNITPDHLDRYTSFKDYVDAKARIFENQREDDFLILNYDDPEIMKLYSSQFTAHRSRSPKVFFFSRKKEIEGVYFKDGMIYLNFPNYSLLPPHSLLIDVRDIKIKGVHNLENAMAASATALLSDCGVEAIRKALMDFGGLEHRLEFVEEIKGVSFINDSKGTNVGAVLKSLEGFQGPVILIAGGLDKASDFTLLRDPVKKKVKRLILIGDAKEKIRRAIGDLTETSYAEEMEEAVMMAFQEVRPGDVVLLSPACASFDMFKDFEDRGRRFKEAVRRLKNA